VQVDLVLIVRAHAAYPIGQLDRRPHSPANLQNESNCVEGCQVSFKGDGEQE
jgi:hypothetical protein